jgi:hypothetical protein
LSTTKAAIGVESLEEEISTRPWDETLGALWEVARKSALNIGELLDSIMKDVETASNEAPVDDDIPF